MANIASIVDSIIAQHRRWNGLFDGIRTATTLADIPDFKAATAHLDIASKWPVGDAVARAAHQAFNVDGLLDRMAPALAAHSHFAETWQAIDRIAGELQTRNRELTSVFTITPIDTKSLFADLGLGAQIKAISDFSKLLSADHLRLLHDNLGITSIIAEVERSTKFLRNIDLAALEAATREIEEAPDEEITPTDIQEAEDICAAPEFQQLSIEAKIDYLYRAQKDKKARSVIRIILIFIAIQCLSAQIKDTYLALRDFIVDNVSPARIIKKVKALLGEAVSDQSDLRSLRIVARPSVSVRTGYKRRSRPVAILTAGRWVRLIQKRKKWAFVEWPDQQTGLTMRGWVRHKYLKRVWRK